MRSHAEAKRSVGFKYSSNIMCKGPVVVANMVSKPGK